jgi:hypothetical protein
MDWICFCSQSTVTWPPGYCRLMSCGSQGIHTLSVGDTELCLLLGVNTIRGDRCELQCPRTRPLASLFPQGFGANAQHRLEVHSWTPVPVVHCCMVWAASVRENWGDPTPRVIRAAQAAWSAQGWASRCLGL